MNESASGEPRETEMILEPPGSVAVIGAGPLGIEAALYGRFLGYDVTLFEAERVGNAIVNDDQPWRDLPIPMLPDRCVSPLAWSALEAQSGSEMPREFPTTLGGWLDRVWLPLTESDLLSGRLRCPSRVTGMELVPLEADAEEPSDGDSAEGDDEEPAADFRLVLDDGSFADAEAVILATGGETAAQAFLPASTPYLFRVSLDDSLDPEQQFLSGLRQIVKVFAVLGGRPELDLYRPFRG